MIRFLIYIFLFLFTFTSSVNAGYSDAINRGKTGAGIFSLKNFGNENTNGMNNTEWMKENNLTIGSAGSLSLLNDVNNDKLGNGEGNPQVATATGCSLGPIGCVAGAGIDWIVAGTVATSVATAGLVLYNSSNDNSSGQEPENMNNNDNNGGDKDPNSWCAKHPKLCLDFKRSTPKNLLEKLTLDEAKSGAGEPIMENRIKDPKYKDTHTKYEHTHKSPDGKNITVHYWKNNSSGELSGFKFK